MASSASNLPVCQRRVNRPLSPSILNFSGFFMLKLRALLLVVPALLTAQAISAQSIPSPYRFIERGQEAGLFTGSMTTNTGRFNLGPGDQTMVGARYSVEVSGPVALEGLASMALGPRAVVNPNRLEGDQVVDEAEMQVLFLEARLRFNLTGRRTWRGLQPYTFIGGGVGFDTIGRQAEDQLLDEEDRYEFGTRWTGNFGVGSRWLFSSRFHLRFDAGWRLYKVGIPTGWRDPALGDLNVPEDEWVSGRSITVGLGYRF
jgi:hypothetical protein